MPCRTRLHGKKLRRTSLDGPEGHCWRLRDGHAAMRGNRAPGCRFPCDKLPFVPYGGDERAGEKAIIRSTKAEGQPVLEGGAAFSGSGGDMKIRALFVQTCIVGALSILAVIG